MTATAAWFGPAGRPLFGWLHLPDSGSARAGVVLCAPSGYEYVSAHRTLRDLAERLADAGVAALRFDYDGTGDSAGLTTDSGRVEAWRASIREAIAFMRQCAPMPVGAVGMRLGALLAADCADALDHLVLWDPVWSGRALMRQLRAVHLVGVGPPPAEGGEDVLEVAGVVYSSETSAELRTLEFPDLSASTAPTLVLTRPNATAKPPADRLPETATLATALGQEELLDREAPISMVPGATVAEIAAWLDTTVPATAVPAAVPDVARRTVTVDGVTETAVRIGPLGLFGIVAEPGAGTPGHAAHPTLVLLNNATDHHVGPIRLWVDWGRAMAEAGFHVVRFDLSGIGDSPARPDQPLDRAYPVDRFEDIAAAVAAYGDHGVTLVGACSGGRNVIDAALRIPVAGVCAINVFLHTPEIALPQISHDNPQPAAMAKAWRWHPIRHRLFVRLPTPLWRALDRLGLVVSPARPLLALADRGVDTLVIFGTHEYGLVKIQEKSRWALRDLAGRPRFHFEFVQDLDHAMMRRQSREKAVQLLTDHIVRQQQRVATTG